MLTIASSTSFHPAGIRAMSMFREGETTDAVAGYQSWQPARLLLRRSERMNCLDREGALHRSQRAQTRIGPLQFLHDQAIGSVANCCAAALSQVRSIKAQRAHSRDQMFRELSRTMTRHDLRQDFFLHKTPGPIARRLLLIGEKFFDVVVVKRSHAPQECAPL